GLAVLPYYLCYRALVRAKVDLIRVRQSVDSERETIKTGILAYLQLAKSYTHSAGPKLIITRGVSASGKSTLTQLLLQSMDAIRIRSDIERKRLFGLKGDEDSRASIDQGIYSSDATQRTYGKLIELAASILDAGYSVIVDAVFLDLIQREPFQKLAADKHAPYLILELTASPETLRQRIEARKHDASDADLSVLEHQLSRWEPLCEKEERCQIRINTEDFLGIDSLMEKIRANT
ncbi:MAG: AAA family ATPase, partial [Waddliaceae bacterium]